MTQEEAFLIFDKLHTTQSAVFCMGKLSGWTFAVRGTIMSATQEEIILVSADLRSGSMSFRLDAEDLLLRHAEPREILMLQGLPERDATLAAITIGLPLRLRPADLRARLLEAPPREVLYFLELPRNEESGTATSREINGRGL